MSWGFEGLGVRRSGRNMTGRALDSPRWAPVWSRALCRAFAGMRETGDSASALKELAGQRAEPHEPSGGHQAAHRQAHSTEPYPGRGGG